VHKADNLTTICAVVMKSGNLNFLERSGSIQACNRTALPFLHASVQVCRWQFLTFVATRVNMRNVLYHILRLYFITLINSVRMLMFCNYS
jgi:hypothetical protein